MNFLRTIESFLGKSFFERRSTTFFLWLLLPVIVFLVKGLGEQYNNYLIFRESFYHAFEYLSLYVAYPEEYQDIFLYGPLFPVLMSPFSVLPVKVGLLLWGVSLSMFLYFAISNLSIDRKKMCFVYWFCAHELLTALFMWQFNIAIVGCIVFSFVCIEKKKDFWAAFFIVAGMLTKIYGIVGLAFFLFSKRKKYLFFSLLFWFIFLMILPAVIFGVDYVSDQYIEWVQVLQAKNSGNLFSLMQNISFLGMVRKISGLSTYSDFWLILAGLIMFAIPYLRRAQYQFESFRLCYLASVLLFVVLFSTGSESSTYIIAFVGVALWYISVPWKRSFFDLVLLIFAFILTSLSPSDLFPKIIRVNYVYPYALKALPCCIIWLKLCAEMMVKDYGD